MRLVSRANVSSPTTVLSRSLGSSNPINVIHATVAGLKSLNRPEEIAARNDLVIMNVFHAGDGNLHPLILFDSQIPGEVERVRKAGHEILEVCAEVGGTITGEHGVGIEKQEEMALIFNEVDLRIMQQVRGAWNPDQLFNPGKLFPMPGRCADMKQL